MWDFSFKGSNASSVGFVTLKKYIPDLPEVDLDKMLRG